MLDLGFTCLYVYGDHCVIEAEQPAFMQGVWKVIGLLPDPRYRHLGICIRFGAFPRSSWRPLGAAGRLQKAFLEDSRGSWKASWTLQEALGRSGPLQEASRTLRDDRGRLKHYACNGLEASSQAYESQETLLATARAEPTEHTNSTRLLFL